MDWGLLMEMFKKKRQAPSNLMMHGGSQFYSDTPKDSWPGQNPKFYNNRWDLSKDLISDQRAMPPMAYSDKQATETAQNGWSPQWDHRPILETLLQQDLDRQLSANRFFKQAEENGRGNNDYFRMGMRGIPDADRLQMPMGRPM